MQNGPRKRLKPSKLKRPNIIKGIMTNRSKQQPWRLETQVLVHVTTFKGHHKTQDRWKNREYVVEKWPYPNVPVYVVSPRDGGGCSWTLHYLLLINFNTGQDEKDAPMAGVGNTNPFNSRAICGQ